MIGRVISTKLKGTATILVERVAMHPLYKKTFIRSKKYLVGTDEGVKIGDIVEFVNCKPISRNKHWKIAKVTGRSVTEIAEEKLKQQAEEIISEVIPEEKTKESSVVSPQTEEVEEKQKKRKKKKGKSES